MNEIDYNCATALHHDVSTFPNVISTRCQTTRCLPLSSVMRTIISCGLIEVSHLVWYPLFLVFMYYSRELSYEHAPKASRLGCSTRMHGDTSPQPRDVVCSKGTLHSTGAGTGWRTRVDHYVSRISSYIAISSSTTLSNNLVPAWADGQNLECPKLVVLASRFDKRTTSNISLRDDANVSIAA